MQRHFVKRRKGVYALNNYYLTYERTEKTKYVSHLDFVRMFGRAMRRAHLPIAFSEGFNPHPLLGFALPLSVGYTSECEILEITLTEPLPLKEIMVKLNEVLPQGVKITSVSEGKSRMKALDYALYIVRAENIPESVEEFLSKESILIEKKTKSGIKETDIRPDIKSIDVLQGRMEMVLRAGSRANLKPEVVINAMNKYIEGYKSGECEYHRKKIFDAQMAEIN